ncbi:MAG: hypothetical protein ABR518_01035 [Actinomycetota bacterium]
MRRFTLITLVVLFVGLGIAAWFQFRAAEGERRFCGPGVKNCAPGTPNPSLIPSPTGS